MTTELERRRELTSLTKPELVTIVIALESNLTTVREAIERLTARIDHAYGDEP